VGDKEFLIRIKYGVAWVSKKISGGKTEKNTVRRRSLKECGIG
jgi:hypothetical protein